MAASASALAVAFACAEAVAFACALAVAFAWALAVARAVALAVADAVLLAVALAFAEAAASFAVCGFLDAAVATLVVLAPVADVFFAVTAGLWRLAVCFATATA